MFTLTSLDLTHCNITDQAFTALASFQYLNSLSLKGCFKITDAALTALRNLSNLTSINFEGSNRGDRALHALIPLTKLKILNFSWCYKITDEGVTALSNLTNLTFLDLTACSQITSQALTSLVKLEKLNFLALNCCCQITDIGLTILNNLSNLTSLELGACNISTDGLTLLHKLQKLHSLDIHGNNINLKGLTLLKLTNLTSLDIADSNDRSSTDFEVLSRFPNLTSLNISYWKMSDENLFSLKNLQNLTSLEIDSCRGITLQGVVKLVSSLTNLSYLGLHFSDACETDMDSLKRDGLEIYLG